MAYKRKERLARPLMLNEPSPEFLPGISLVELEQAPEAKPKLGEEQWWNDLSINEQMVLQVEGQGLAVALLVQGYSRLAIGAHLVKVQAILEPHSLFGRFLRLFRFTPRTAYRYIQRYNNASSHLPEAILRAAMARGIDMSGESAEMPLGKFTPAVKLLPPPADPSPDDANIWINKVIEVQKETRGGDLITAAAGPQLAQSIPQDPETLLKECYRFITTRYRKLPINGRSRSKWVHDLAGMLLAELGIGHAQTIKPIAIPDDFRAQRGRPRAEEVAA
jgi:hypothetical protein